MIEVKKAYSANGNIKYEYHFLNGKIHREDQPAIIYYYPNGNIWYEEYWLDGKRHREDGPAYISYYRNGDICRKEYYLNCNYLIKEEWFNQLSTEAKLKFTFGSNND
jgi:antitoxin component YwqK of YwqJK toxin-antitoxin module